VTLAADGETALALLAVKPFDAVLMDIQMPGMDGFETMRRIRESAPPLELPVIAMTAHALASDRERSRAAGMADHITKPIEPAILYETLRRHIAPPQASAARAAPWQPSGQPPAPRAAPRAEATPGAPVFDVAQLHLEGLDLEGSLERLGGDQTLYADLLRQFADRYADRATALRVLVEAGDLGQAKALAHSLRGVTGNLGAKGVEAATAEVEQALAPGAAPERLAAALAKLEDVMARFVEGLSALGAPAPERETAARTVSLAERKAALEALAQALRLRRPRPCEAALDALRAMDWPAAAQGAIADLGAKTKRFRYAEALARTETLLAELKEEPTP